MHPFFSTFPLGAIPEGNNQSDPLRARGVWFSLLRAMIVMYTCFPIPPPKKYFWKLCIANHILAFAYCSSIWGDNKKWNAPCCKSIDRKSRACFNGHGEGKDKVQIPLLKLLIPGTGCPGRLGNLHSWRLSNLNRTRPWLTRSNFELALLWAKGCARWPPEIPSNSTCSLNHSRIFDPSRNTA